MTDIISLIAVFAPLFSERVWSHAQLLLVGAILAPGKRTVTSVLRVMGRSEELRFTNFDWVLNRVKWSTRQGSRILLGLLVTAFVPAGHPLILGADDTVERRRGKKIRQVGCYRDAVRSSQSHVVLCFGLKWVLFHRYVVDFDAPRTASRSLGGEHNDVLAGFFILVDRMLFGGGGAVVKVP